MSVAPILSDMCLTCRPLRSIAHEIYRESAICCGGNKAVTEGGKMHLVLFGMNKIVTLIL